MSFSYTAMDQLLIERWTDVVGLIAAHREVQDRIEEMIGVVGERVARWAQPQGFDVETNAKDGEFYAWRPAWADRRKGARVQLALGGVCPLGYRKTDERYPYLWVYIDGLENYRVKDAERASFARALRSALHDEARNWEADGVNDEEQPLGRFLTNVSDVDRTKLIASPDALFDFVTGQYPAVFKLADTIEAELAKLGR